MQISNARMGVKGYGTGMSLDSAILVNYRNYFVIFGKIV